MLHRAFFRRCRIQQVNPDGVAQVFGGGNLGRAFPRSFWQGEVGRQKISRSNDFAQAGERYRSFETWEREELIGNLVGALSGCADVIQDKMIAHFTRADADYGRRVAEGLGRKVQRLDAAE